MENFPLSGSVFAINGLGVTGVPEERFAGWDVGTADVMRDGARQGCAVWGDSVLAGSDNA
ncbi:MAG: hypothetical protein AAF580_04920 [Pseudomonadota bacterium]